MGRLTKRMRQACIVAFAFTGLLQAQSQNAANVPLRGPHEGFVFDGPTRSIRAVNGMLGAASMGPVLLPELEYASLAPNADYGVAFRPGECLWVSNLESGQASTAAISRCSSLP